MPPLKFYTKNHGKHIMIYNNGYTARRIEHGRDEGHVFSARPVQIDEKVYLRIPIPWNGDIRFGFTSQDPSSKQRSLAEHWAVYVVHTENDYAKRANILYYHVNSAGQVYYGVDGEDKGWLFSVLVQRPLWVFVEIHFRGTEVQFESFESTQSPFKGQQFSDKNMAMARSGYGSRCESKAARDGSAKSGVTGRVSVKGVGSGDVSAMGVPSRDAGGTDTAGRVDAATTAMSLLPPLSFHDVHGSALRITSNGSGVERVLPGSGDGDAFSSRPITVNEKVCLRFVNISDDRENTIRLIKLRFGFTARDPATPAHCLPKRQKENWIWSLDEEFHRKDNTICCHVCPLGGVLISVNKKHLGFSSVDTTSPLWVMVQINGLGTAIQFEQFDTQNTRANQSPIEERLIGELQFLSIETTLPQQTYQELLIPLTLHKTKGRNIRLSSEFASRIEGTFNQGYVFTALPVLPSQTIIIQIFSVRTTQADRKGGLAYGLTSCDPAKLSQCDLPDDTDQLLDRPEYWVVRQNAAEGLGWGDKLAITLTENGEVKENRNNSYPITVMHVDHTLKLWAFLDLYETTRKVRMVITRPVESPQSRAQESSESESLQPSTSRQNQPEPTDVRHEKITKEPTNVRHEERTKEPADVGQETECSICFDRQVDCALYKCGHVCMCYMCAMQLCQDGGGRCPICRAQIKEVIRIFKS